MHNPTSQARPTPSVGTRRRDASPPPSQRPSAALRSRHMEAQAVAWLRSLRSAKRVQS
jgi:hypothetical protein